MYGDYIDRYWALKEFCFSDMENMEKNYLSTVENMLSYNDCYNKEVFENIKINAGDTHYAFYDMQTMTGLSNIYKNVCMENSSVSNNESTVFNKEKNYKAYEYGNSLFKTMYDESNVYSNVDNKESSLYKSYEDNSCYDYVNTSDIKDSVSNSFSDVTRNINISMGGITQNFAGGENAGDIAESLCVYLKKALNNSAEGAYF